MKEARQLINQYFIRQKKANKDLSLRSLALKLKISPGYLSKVLSGKKSLNAELALQLCKELKVDKLQLDQIKASLHQDLIDANFGSHGSQYDSSSTVKMMAEMRLMEPQADWLLEQWYRLALLDLITCSDFHLNIDWISSRLEITPQQASDTLRHLLKEGFVKKNSDGSLAKSHDKLRFPSKYTKEIVRNYHETQMKRAIRCMNTRLSQKDFENRLVVGINLAGNPQNLEKAKEIIHRALYEASEILSSGDCTEVYHIGLQLFPQTSSGRKT